MKRIVLLSILCFSTLTFSQDGTLDNSFATTGDYSNLFGFSAIYPQIRINCDNNTTNVFFAGQHNNQFAFGSFQLLDNGTLNTSLFNNGIDISYEDPNFFDDGFPVQLLADDNSQSLYSLANVFYSTDNVQYSGISKLLPNGISDGNYGLGGVAFVALEGTNGDPLSTRASKMRLQSDNKMIVVGDVFNNPNIRGFIARYDANGDLDPTFSYINSNSYGYRYLNLSGILPNMNVKDVAVLSDNSSIILGHSTPLSDRSLFFIKILPNGTEDITFGTNGWILHRKGNKNTKGLAIYPNTDGSFMVLLSVAGETTPGTYNFYLAKFTSNFNLDTSFGNNGYALINNSPITFTDEDIAHFRDFDGRFLIAIENILYRFLPNGQLDTAFGCCGNGTYSDGYGQIVEVATKNNGKINIVVHNNFFEEYYLRQLNGSTTLATNENNLNSSNIALFPNPTTDVLNFSKEISNYTIVDISGRVITNIKNKTNQINVNSLKEGVYIITFEDENGNKQSQKFIKK